MVILQMYLQKLVYILLYTLALKSSISHSEKGVITKFKVSQPVNCYLEKNKIMTAIHYPKPIHLQPVCKKYNYNKGDFTETEKQAKSILTLPVNQFLTLNNLRYIVNRVHNLYE